MIPNIEIWGSPSTWEISTISDVGTYNDWIEGKFAPFDTSELSNSSRRYSISAGVNAGKLTPGQPFDASCCPWRIKGDSYFLQLQKLWFSDTSTAHNSPLYSDIVRQQGVPVMLSTLPTNASRPRMTELTGIWNPDPAAPGVTPAYSTAPLLQFNYKKIFIHAKICCSASYDTEPGDSRVYSVDDYFDNQSQLYPYVRGLMFDVYLWNGSAWRMVDYGLFNIIPVNAYISGFECGAVTIVNNDFTVFRDGINGQAIGRLSNKNDGIAFDDSFIGADASTSFANQMSSSQSSISYVAAPEDWTIHVFTRWGIHYAAPYKQNVQKEWILQQFATLGLWFYTGYTPLQCNTTDPDEHTYIPLFDEWGTTTGEYMSGTAALTAPAAAWTNDVFSRDIYHGEPPYDPSNYDPDNTTIFNVTGVPTKSINIYAFASSNVNDPLSYLYLSAFNSSEAQFAVKNFLSVSPIDTVQSVMFFPLAIVPELLLNDSIFTTVQAPLTNVVYGNITSDIQANHIPQQTVILDMGYIDIYRHFNDFRDYEPYTAIELYLPFCGFTSIDCSLFMGKQLKIKYIIDFLTGGCTACILANDLLVQTVNGQIGIQIPVTGAQTAQMRQAYDNAQLQYKQAQTTTTATVAALAIGAVATAATGGTAAPIIAAGAAGGISALTSAQKAGEKLDYEIQHMTTPFKTVGGSTSAISYQMELTPRVIITRPKMLNSFDIEAFATTQGFACCYSGSLENVSGYTQCSAVDLSGINATADEKEIINKLLLQGVIL